MNKDQFEKLKKEFTNQELVEGFVFPVEKDEYDDAQKEIRALRLKELKDATEMDRIFSDLARLKYLILGYFENGTYDTNYSFPTMVNEYIRIIKKTKKAFAQDLGIHTTRLSRILNEKEDPNIELAYRLEKHSGNLISAVSWWKLHTLRQEYFIGIDQGKRKTEAAKVQNGFKFKFSA